MSSKIRPMGPVPCHWKSDLWDRTHRSNFEVHGTSYISYNSNCFWCNSCKVPHVIKNQTYQTGPMSLKIRPMAPVPCHQILDRSDVIENYTYGTDPLAYMGLHIMTSLFHASAEDRSSYWSQFLLVLGIVPTTDPFFSFWCLGWRDVGWGRASGQLATISGYISGGGGVTFFITTTE